MNFRYMLKRNRDRTLQDMSNGAVVVIKHLFDHREYCDDDWCRARKRQKRQKDDSPSTANEGNLELNSELK